MTERTIGDYLISTDKSKLDVPLIHDFLTNRSYWAKGIPLQTVQQAIEHSMAIGVYHSSGQVGFARVITDYTTFAYMADVFILEAHRKQGLSKQLIQFILDQEFTKQVRRLVLATRDAHSLYASFGFTPLDNPDSFMQIHTPNKYLLHP
jgi:N-acetylglutamate synthase-like GNAT family acetyltransferase